MRMVMARVLPVPAPASTHTGPLGAMTTSRCSGSRPSSSRRAPSMRGILTEPADVGVQDRPASWRSHGRRAVGSAGSRPYPGHMAGKQDKAATKEAAKARRAERRARRGQIFEAFKMQRREDKALVPLMIGVFL